MEAKARGGDHIVAWGDGSPTREFLYVTDAAEGIVLAAERYNGAAPVNPSTSFRTSLGSSFETCPECNRRISIKDLMETIARLTGFEGDIIWDTTKPNGQPRRKLDVSKAEQYFGFRSQVTFETGLKEAIAWYVAQTEPAHLSGAIPA